MGNSIGTLLVSAVLLTVVMMMSRTAIFSSTLVAITTIQSADLSGQRVRTMLSIESTAVNGADLTAQVKNTGGMTIADFPHMDFIVQYESDSGQWVIQRLTYKDGSPGDNEWTVESIAPDDFEPGILNPGETMALEAKLAPPIKNGTTGTLAVVTPNGIAITAYFFS